LNLTTESRVTITEPTDPQISAWWKWATSFSKNASPFELGWANESDRNEERQPQAVFCISGTAGQEDKVTRPLDAAIKSGKNILVPVIVAYGESESEAKKLLGKPKVKFLVNGVSQKAFYKETNVGSANFADNNSFDEDPGRKTIYSAGYWANISPTNLEEIQFGGNGGQINSKNQSEFQTLVTYGVRGQRKIA
jgi:hypothetical protein